MKPSASSCSQNAGSSSGPSLGSGDAEGWPRTGNVSTAKRSLSSSSLLFASCFESYAIQDDVPGQTLSKGPDGVVVRRRLTRQAIQYTAVVGTTRIDGTFSAGSLTTADQQRQATYGLLGRSVGLD